MTKYLIAFSCPFYDSTRIYSATIHGDYISVLYDLIRVFPNGQPLASFDTEFWYVAAEYQQFFQIPDGLGFSDITIRVVEER